MQPKLQMDILRDIAGRIDIPLVLHGGSANPDAEIAESVTLGVGKINISSDMKYAYFQKVREILAKESWWTRTSSIRMRLTRRGKSFATK